MSSNILGQAGFFLTMSLVPLGIGLGVFASMTGTIGKQLLRFSELCKRKGLTYPSKVAFGIGLALNTAVGPIVDMLSYMFAPQSLIAPLGGLDVVWNTLIAPCTLGEKLTPTVCFGAFLIAAGATCTSLFGNQDDKDYNLELVEKTFVRLSVLIYLLVLICWLAFNILFLQPRSKNPKGEPWETGDPIRGLSLGLTAGSIAGNMFCVKGFIELVQASIRDQDSSVWAHWLPYVLLVGAIAFAVTNLKFLTTAMREYEALFMGAVFEGSLIVCACISGIVVYKDLENLEVYQIIIYFVALLCIVVGIGVVAIGCWKPEEPEDEEAEKKGEGDTPEERLANVCTDEPDPEAGKLDAVAPTEQPKIVECSPVSGNSLSTRDRTESTGSLNSNRSAMRFLSKRPRSITIEADCNFSPFPGAGAIHVESALLSRRSRASSNVSSSATPSNRPANLLTPASVTSADVVGHPATEAATEKNGKTFDERKE